MAPATITQLSSSPPTHPTTHSGLHASSRTTGKVAKWVCDRCGAMIDKRKCSFDEAAADGYNVFEGSGACDHAEQTMRYVL